MSDINTGTVSTSQDYTNSYRNQMQESLIDAINILYKGAVAKENISKTLECVISDASERDKGIYKVDYMKNIFEVSCPLSTVYDVGDAVFVLVPDGDFSKTKIIVGSAEGNTGGSSGADVEANPAGTATDTLEKLRVGTTIYSIEGGPADAVTDVKVNGTSVVGSDHVARVSAVTQAQLENALETKADVSDLSALEGTVSDLTTTVNGKASQSSLEALATIVGTKANAADVNAALNLKADQSDLSDLITVVNGKANISDIPEIEANPSETATGTLTKIDIDGTVYDLQAGSNYTAGMYIDIDNNDVINVNRVLPNGHVTYTFKTKSTGGYDATITITKESGGVVEQSRDYIYTSVRTPITIDDKFTFSYVNSWAYTLLEDTSDHTAGYTKSQGYQEVVDIPETFVSVDRSGQTLVIKSEMDAALTGKQNTLTFDNVPTQNSDNPVKSGGVYSALANILDGSTIDSFGDVETALSGKADTSDIPEIEVNPSDTATDTLTKIDIDGTVYDLAGGTTVIANPSGSATDELEKVQIGNTIYSLPSGGGTIETIIPTTEHATSERNSTAQDTYTATDDMYAIAVNLSINGEASNYTQTCSITTDGEVLDTMTNHQDTQDSPNRNYAIVVDSLNLASGDDVDFTNTGTATYIVRLRGVIGLNQEVRLINEISNVIVSDNTNNSRTVTLSPNKVYMVLAFGTSGNGGAAGDINVTSTGTITFTTLSAQSAKMICAFIVAGSSVTISFGNDANYYSKGHIIYEVDVKKIEYATKEDLENYVVANPEDTPTDNISSIKIGDTVYDISGSGSSTNYGKFKCDVLFDTPTTISAWATPIDVCSEEKVKEYDMLYILSSTYTDEPLVETVLVDAIGNASTSFYIASPRTNSNVSATQGFVFLAFDSGKLKFYTGTGQSVTLVKVYGIKFENKLINRSDIYSEEERMIGRWTDGKPLYQKTVEFNFTSNTNDWTVFDTSVSYDRFIQAVAATKGVNVTEDQIMSYQDSLTSPRWCVKNDHKLYYYLENAPRKGAVTLQYTKTTDSADSGVIPEDPMFISDPMIYSEEEQVVGSWTDGKPLYQKTFLQNWTSDGEYHIDVTSLHIDKFIKSEGYANRYDVTEFSEEINANYINNINSYKFLVWYNRESEYLRVLLYMPEHKSSRQSITIQYTKTTDSILSGPKKGKIVQRSDIYSEEERLVGRWTDGKPLYQKTWTLSSTININTSGVTLPSQIGNDLSVAENIVNANAVRLKTDNASVACIPLYVWGSGTSYSALCSDSWSLVREITIQYTKTTDAPFSKQLIEDPQFVMMSDIYSEEEQVVGRWTDGKPLYQKTIITTNTTINNWVRVDISSLNIDNLCDLYGQFARYTNNKDYWYNFTGAENLYSGNYVGVLRFDFENGDGELTYRINFEATNKQIFTLQYTKTTDAPGTGPTKGNLIYLPALYSEEEREVGVWTDGKPLYQKTYRNIQLTNSADVTVDSNYSNKNVINFECFTDGVENNVRYITPTQSLNTYNDFVWPRVAGDDLKIIVNRDWRSYTCTLTVQYTKTTDQPGSGTFLTDGTPSHHYSTSEKVVGTWIDGSTIYEQVFALSSVITIGNDWVSTGITIPNVSKILRADALRGNGECCICLDAVIVSGGTIKVTKESTGWTNVTHIILQYTKSS